MALLPPFYLDTVVAIGVGSDPAKRHWIGTWFLFGCLLDEKGPKDHKLYEIWLITNKHVLQGFKEIYLKFNSGLAAVDPVDSILETVELASRRLQGRTAQARYRAKKQKQKAGTQIPEIQAIEAIVK